MDIEVRVLGPVEVAQVTGGSAAAPWARRAPVAGLDRRSRPDRRRRRPHRPAVARGGAAACHRICSQPSRKASASVRVVDHRSRQDGVSPRRVRARPGSLPGSRRSSPGARPAPRRLPRRPIDRALALVRGRPLHEVADEVWAMPTAAAIAEQLASAEELWAALSLEDRPADRRRPSSPAGRHRAAAP